MPGNSQRRGATRKGKNKAAGSGGRIRRSLAGKGPTPKAEDRVYHKAHKAKQANQRRQQAAPRKRAQLAGADWIVGRNPVLEALRAGLPVKQAFVAEGAERDDRMRDILKYAAEHSLPLLQVPRSELDRATGGLVHQGIAVQLPAYDYADAEDIFAEAATTGSIVVALDGVTDPRNLGAIIRSAAAFGAAGIILPQRRSASMSAAAWKTSAGAAARLPIAQETNLNRSLQKAWDQGFSLIGLAGEAEQSLSSLPGGADPVVLVVGSEDDGLARLTRERCDVLVSIPIANSVESLNASVAASVALYELSQRRG